MGLEHMLVRSFIRLGDKLHDLRNDQIQDGRVRPARGHIHSCIKDFRNQESLAALVRDPGEYWLVVVPCGTPNVVAFYGLPMFPF